MIHPAREVVVDRDARYFFYHPAEISRGDADLIRIELYLPLPSEISF